MAKKILHSAQNVCIGKSKVFLVAINIFLPSNTALNRFTILY